MKKMIILLSMTFAGLSAFSQFENGNDQGRYGNQHGNPGHNTYGNNQNQNYDPYRITNIRTEADLLRDLNLTRQQEKKINRINDRFRDQAYRIQMDRFSSAQQKRWQMERLERERKQDIINVLNSYQRDRYNAWCNRNNGFSTTYGNNGNNNGYGNGKW
jgi:hypothetical protein